jgi:hypothetical protein
MTRSLRVVAASAVVMLISVGAMSTGAGAIAAGPPAGHSGPGGPPQAGAGRSTPSGSTATPPVGAPGVQRHIVVPSTWSLASTPNPGADYSLLVSDACPDATDCMAVGYSLAAENAFPQTLIESWNGSMWAVVPSPNIGSGENELYGVSCVGMSFCVAVGSFSATTDMGTPLIEAWNGSVWSTVPSPNVAGAQGAGSYLNGVSCVSTVFCLAVGKTDATIDQTFVEVWNGSAWTVVSSPIVGTGAGVLYGVSCVSALWCEAVGSDEVTPQANNAALIEQWNGTAMSVVSSPNNSDNSNELGGVSCAGPSLCVAAGDSYNFNIDLDLVEQWNGSAWSVAAVPDANTTFGDGLDAVDCFGPTSCVAGGWVYTDDTEDMYQNQIATWNGSTWAQSAVPNPSSTTPKDYLFGLACAAGHMCVGVGLGNSGTGPTQTLAVSSPVARPGYSEVASDGGIFNFGSKYFGSTGGIKLNQPIVGMAETPDGGGYWLVASDGGIFTFGDAGFFGSHGGSPLNKPIVGMASTPDGQGYWLVASDGGIFTYGDAGFFGSQGSTVLNKPIVGMAATPDGQGYWLVASDGGIFTHGDAAFGGSEGGTVLNKPVVGMAA